MERPCGSPSGALPTMTREADHGTLVIGPTVEAPDRSSRTVIATRSPLTPIPEEPPVPPPKTSA